LSLLCPLIEYAESSPLEWMDWLPAQDAFLRSSDRRKLLRAGNQAHGKTTVGCAELAWRCLGQHPYRSVPPAPVHWWAISSSERSSGILQRKLWELMPKSQVREETFYDYSKGAFVGKYPLMRLHNGSIVEFRWTGSRTLNLASETLSGVWFDEPPSRQRAFSEVERRLTRTGGDLVMTFTPVNAPVDYIQDLAERGKIRDLHYSLRPEHLIPVGRRSPICTVDGTPMDAAWIQEQREIVASWEAPVVLDGEWEFRSVGAVFDAWDPARFTARMSLPSHELSLALGIDYGGESLRMCVVLVAVDDSGLYPVIYVLDEYVADRATTTDEDAAYVLEMLRRHRISWSDLDYATGDIRWSGRKGDVATKSNTDMMRALEDELRLRRGGLKPTIRNAKKGREAGRGSVLRGVRFLHQAMVRQQQSLWVSPRCPNLIRALGRWDWTETDKDPVDAFRYALKPWIFKATGATMPVSYQIEIRR